jgi:periplasmic divalent cation tolerance protein
MTMTTIPESTDGLLVISNFPDLQSARDLAHAIVERQLAACVNILPAVRAIYRWQNVVEETAEVTVMIKTTSARYAGLEQAINDAHPYDVPEIIALPITAGLPAYMTWLAQQTTEDGNA